MNLIFNFIVFHMVVELSVVMIKVFSLGTGPCTTNLLVGVMEVPCTHTDAWYIAEDETTIPRVSMVPYQAQCCTGTLVIIKHALGISLCFIMCSYASAIAFYFLIA